MNSEKFLLDSNVFMTPSRAYYPFDFAQGFWRQMRTALHSGNVFILDVIYNEIMKGKDDLAEWFKDTIANTSCQLRVQDKGIVNEYAKIQNYISTCDLYQPQAISEWAKFEIADPWLIATAIAKKYAIITLEIHGNPQPHQKAKRIKILDVADHFCVSYHDLFYFMRKMKFSWP